MGGAAPPQMLRRCGWLSMTFSWQRQVVTTGQSTTINLTLYQVVAAPFTIRHGLNRPLAGQPLQLPGRQAQLPAENFLIVLADLWRRMPQPPGGPGQPIGSARIYQR